MCYYIYLFFWESNKSLGIDFWILELKHKDKETWNKYLSDKKLLEGGILTLAHAWKK